MLTNFDSDMLQYQCYLSSPGYCCVSETEFPLLEAKRKVPTISTMDVSSWKDNPSDARTKMMVGVNP